jgi:hypothetical protein
VSRLSRRQIQTKLNQLVRIANELDEEAKARWGESGFLFFEADGAFHMMSGDSDKGLKERTDHIQMSSDGYCKMGSGAW